MDRKISSACFSTLRIGCGSSLPLPFYPGYWGIYLGFMFRFHVPLVAKMKVDPEASTLSHNAYISNIGYAQLDRIIPRDAVVQFNPVVRPVPFWASVV